MKNLLLCLLLIGCSAPKPEPPPEPPPEPLMIEIEPSYGMTVEPNPDGPGVIVTRADGTVEAYDRSNQTQEEIDAALQRHFEAMYEHAGPEDREVVDDHQRAWGWKDN